MTNNLTNDIFFKFRETLRDVGVRDGKFFITGKKIYPIFEPTPSVIIRFIFDFDEQRFTLIGPMVTDNDFRHNPEFLSEIHWIGIPPTEEQLILMKLLFV